MIAQPPDRGKLCVMAIAPERVLSNLREVRDRMAAAAARSGRRAEAVRLVAVTKTVSEETIRTLVEAGQRDLGESRAQQLRDRARDLASLPIAWHMIGRLQRKNAKYIIPAAAMIHSVDSLELAEEIGKRGAAASAQGTAGQAGRGTPVVCLLEVNSGEEQKGGVRPAEAPAIARAVAAVPGIKLAGLMTMAPLADDPQTVRPVFAALRQLLERINRDGGLPQPLAELSMGMTQDYEAAIEEGATIVRVGTALFR
jgi:hypothetical protein